LPKFSGKKDKSNKVFLILRENLWSLFIKYK
jgi:hypothetical protein